MASDPATTLIIGAGPAGLAMAARLSRLGLPYVLLEQTQQVAPAWQQHYERLHLHTTKELSFLPFIPFPDSYPRYVSRAQVVEYLEAYAEKMGIKPVFGQEVQRVTRLADGQWEVHTAQEETFLGGQVVICTGFNRRPHEPTWPDQNKFQGEILHSRYYKNGAPFAGKRVLVVGMGNTGAEIAVDLYEQGAQPFLSVRSPVNIVMRDPFGRPVQKTALMLAKLPPWLGDTLGTVTSRLTVGNLKPYGIERPSLSPSKQLRVTGKTPVIDVGAVPLIKQRKVKVLPGISRFTPEGVVFSDGQQLPFDGVVLATGYRAAIEEFLVDVTGIFNEHGTPRHWQIDEQPGLFFLGFDAYVPGGLLYVIRNDSEKIAEAIGR
jgi:cation diffusion facilitator CzcD-associated flavoprotein CzcO